MAASLELRLDELGEIFRDLLELRTACLQAVGMEPREPG